MKQFFDPPDNAINRYAAEATSLQFYRGRTQYCSRQGDLRPASGSDLNETNWCINVRLGSAGKREIKKEPNFQRRKLVQMRLSLITGD